MKGTGSTTWRELLKRYAERVTGTHRRTGKEDVDHKRDGSMYLN
jgi:hypothetical protein